ncbi:hypothetical protein [Pseudoduganella armeniaca]|uniref:DUF1795 domain-containing protein n=1 Tax=Pseudoduganella armeniaca TaxID=2072590 RepID=A0A2R4C6W0_9BURK|nr:hypothetical protein [Pseudoduganella armeniaca]AVR95344.1 hypothetical protein C9I28_06140 [Pseudoduganella armeniaca]
MTAPLPLLAALLAAATLTACSPKFDWRDYRGSQAPYAVLFPGKPATHTRSVDLGGQTASMTMAATDIDGTVFAVGSAELADAERAQLAVQAMKAAMVRNIGATRPVESTRDGAFEVEARGARGSQQVTLRGRFLARGKRAYQVIVIGPDNAVSREDAETFLRSFKVN